MNVRHINVGTGVEIVLSEDEIQEFEQSRAWLAIQRLLIWRIQRDDRTIRVPALTGEQSRFFIGRIDAFDNLLMLPEVFRNSSRPETDKTEAAEEDFKRQTETMNHE